MNVQRSTLNNFCQLVKILDRPERLTRFWILIRYLQTNLCTSSMLDNDILVQNKCTLKICFIGLSTRNIA